MVESKSVSEVTLSAKVIRANGKVEDLGEIYNSENVSKENEESNNEEK